ncbi:MAG: RdgB/HAM1 family non-canonical purine NTP pyrophosphatase [Bacteroidetes bacterium]|nr:RdgB/HAM1 family non-canonical purine NTP pyrophosphatase [Bacteroidota bacterium]MDA1120943.1 RdgB/HAM1 family non-canonical purine NTP pyrophosphatase [Bacteroidota bacterium]
MHLCFATNNENKLTEIRQLIGEKFTILSLNDLGHSDDLPEDYFTMEENSLQKAQFINDKYGVDCFADDSGLEVESLGGAPGVHSARYAGPQKNDDDNIDKLLNELRTSNVRKARFRCVITLVLGDMEYQFVGIVSGNISRHRSGAQGFGYDPVFVPNGFNRTFADMSAEEKNALSHRGKAMEQLVDFLAKLN